MSLRDRLMVGHRPLEASILVRIQVPQHFFTIALLADVSSVPAAGQENNREEVPEKS